MLKDSLRTAINAITQKCVAIDAHLVKSRHIADLGAAEGLVRLVKVAKVLGKIDDTIREAIAQAAAPLYDDQDDAGDQSKK